MEKEIKDCVAKNMVIIGSMKIGLSNIQRVWMENDEGEGGDFPVDDIEALLKNYFNKNF